MIRRIFIGLSITAILAITITGWLWPPAFLALIVVAPVIALGVHDMLQTTHTLTRIYPVIGHGRYLMEEVRPEIQQYFVESNIDGRPFAREFRALIYQRAKDARDTVPFGTQRDVDVIGYEWMTHSLAPRPAPETPPRVKVGGPSCTQPYEASYLNISAMSFGSLSQNAILALNTGAQLGGFAHNTGEGGLSPYHLRPGGDVIWQIGTGYFGCRTSDGGFDPALFETKASYAVVKMIEIKLSQGAKPGHGGILPGSKVTAEIAQIRGVPVGEDVLSPPAHKVFDTPKGLLEFVVRLRELSGGKPVGFKLCIGHREEFLAICKAMIETGIRPDFITVDGAEGGTGAAPVELSNSVGMPLRDGLLFVNSALRGAGLREDVRIIAAGKIASAFHMVRAIALGADLCNAARGMMFAIGCIQSRRCNTNDCPVGVATQDASRWKALDVQDKAKRVANYHADTIRAFLEITCANGLCSPAELTPDDVLRRVDAVTIHTFAEVYEYLPEGCLLDGSAPAAWRGWWDEARADTFVP